MIDIIIIGTVVTCHAFVSLQEELKRTVPVTLFFDLPFTPSLTHSLTHSLFHSFRLPIALSIADLFHYIRALSRTALYLSGHGFYIVLVVPRSCDGRDCLLPVYRMATRLGLHEGKRVQVWWPADDRPYAATVATLSSSDIELVYDDNKKATYSLAGSICERIKIGEVCFACGVLGRVQILCTTLAVLI